MQWSDQLSVGISSIDEQHKKIINMINALDDSIKQGDARDTTGKVLEGLAVYTTKHFSYEEDLFAKHGFADSDFHKKEHEDLLKTVTDLKGKYDSGSATIGVETMGFLKDWLNNHIMGTDKQYTDFLVGKGVS